MSALCIDCDGTGRYPSGARCKSCVGTGRVADEDGVPSAFPARTCDPTFTAPTEDLVAVAEYAASLGLHGIFILSPKCPKCGKAHDFTVFADMADAETAVPRLLASMAKSTAREPDFDVDLDERRPQ